jgi:hypothetical protein
MKEPAIEEQAVWDTLESLDPSGARLRVLGLRADLSKSTDEVGPQYAHEHEHEHDRICIV